MEILARIDEGATRANAPDLIDPETANALLRLLRAGRISPEAVSVLLEASSASPLVRHASSKVARPAFELALARGISAYDAFYAVLAELLDLPLVTADGRLAAAVDGSVLVT